MHKILKPVLIWLRVRHQLNRYLIKHIFVQILFLFWSVVLNAGTISFACSAWVTMGSGDGWHATSTWWHCSVVEYSTATTDKTAYCTTVLVRNWSQKQISEPWIVKNVLGENAPNPPQILCGYACIHHLTWRIFHHHWSKYNLQSSIHLNILTERHGHTPPSLCVLEGMRLTD